MDQENQLQQTPTLCRNGCGFYSNASTEGLCSVCYKDTVKKKQQPPNNMPASLAPTPGTMASLCIDEASGAASTSAGAAAQSSSSVSSTSPFSSSSASVETGSPTVIVPSNNDKKSEAEESMSTDVAKASAATPEAGASASADDSNLSGADAASPGGSTPNAPEGKKKKNRCQTCKKKVGLTGFTCRCSGLFCSIHRYSDKHDCGFDYKHAGAEEIRKHNPVIVAEKVQKI